MIYRFAGIELDTQRIELGRGGDTQKLGPRVYAFLLYLIEHRNQVVAKEELLDAVWPDASVSESALQQCAAQVRRVLGQRPGGPVIVETVYGQGYCFAVPVVEVAEEPGPNRRAASAPSGNIVGRTVELRELNGALDRLETGVGGLVLLGGPAGIGKTHVLRELSVLGERRGLCVRHGSCHEQEDVPPYWPFAQSLQDELDHRPGADALPEELASQLASFSRPSTRGPTPTQKRGTGSGLATACSPMYAPS